MKKLLVVFLSLLVVSSVAFAKSDIKSDFVMMSKASQFLFQNGAKVDVLDTAEMKSTRGEFWPGFFILTFGWAAKTYLNAPTNGGWIYSRWPYERRTWYLG